MWISQSKSRLFFIIACRNYFNFGSAILVRFLAQEARSKKQETLKKPEYLITIALAQLLWLGSDEVDLWLRCFSFWTWGNLTIAANEIPFPKNSLEYTWNGFRYSAEKSALLQNDSERNTDLFCLPRNGSERNSECFPFRETGGMTLSRRIIFFSEMATLTPSEPSLSLCSLHVFLKIKLAMHEKKQASNLIIFSHLHIYIYRNWNIFAHQ
jgi:hypothetical protein